LGSLSTDPPNLTRPPGSTDSPFIWSTIEAATFDFSAVQVEPFEFYDLLQAEPQETGTEQVLSAT
jgi:hypothetical protein